MSTSEAAKTKIGAGPKDKPTFLSARVCFFHSQNIAYFDIHIYLRGYLSLLDRVPILFRGLLQLIGAILIVSSSDQSIREILLFDPVTGIVMGITVSLLPFHSICIRVYILEMARIIPAFFIFNYLKFAVSIIEK